MSNPILGYCAEFPTNTQVIQAVKRCLLHQEAVGQAMWAVLWDYCCWREILLVQSPNPNPINLLVLSAPKDGLIGVG